MTAADLTQEALTNGAADNDTDPIGGTPVGTEWDEETDVIISEVVVDVDGGDDNVYYGAAAKVIDTAASGTLTDPAMYLRTGGVPNLGAGVAMILSTSVEDLGVVRVAGKEDGDWATDNITATGTTAASGSNIWDEETFAWADYLVSGIPAKPVGNISITIDGQVVGVIWGTGNPPSSDNGNGNSQCNTVYQIAVATDVNTQITWSTNNRRTAPDGNVGSFSQAVKWTGNDTSIALASDMVADDYYEFAVELTVPAGCPIPTDGTFHCDVDIIGV